MPKNAKFKIENPNKDSGRKSNISNVEKNQQNMIAKTNSMPVAQFSKQKLSKMPILPTRWWKPA